MGGEKPDPHITVADLKSSARTFRTQSKALGDAAAALKKSWDGLGSPWGNDDIGKKFHDSYGPSKTSIDKAAASSSRAWGASTTRATGGKSAALA